MVLVGLDAERGVEMKTGEPFVGTFKLDKETKNTVRYAEEAKRRRREHSVRG